MTEAKVFTSAFTPATLQFRLSTITIFPTQIANITITSSPANTSATMAVDALTPAVCVSGAGQRCQQHFRAIVGLTDGGRCDFSGQYGFAVGYKCQAGYNGPCSDYIQNGIVKIQTSNFCPEVTQVGAIGVTG